MHAGCLAGAAADALELQSRQITDAHLFAPREPFLPGGDALRGRDPHVLGSRVVRGERPVLFRRPLRVGDSPTLAREASTVLDIGSHFGTFALVAAHENPSARVIAVEADKRIAAILRKHAAHYPKIEVLHAAVTEKAGWHRFRGGGQRWRRKRPDEWGRKCRRDPSGGSLRKIRREIR